VAAGTLSRDTEHALLKLPGLGSASAVILFGSYARGDADDGSDIDLLCLDDSAPHLTKEVVETPLGIVDIQRLRVREINTRLMTEQKSCKPFFLRALVEGRVLLERICIAEDVQARAHRIWMEGPARASSSVISGEELTLRMSLARLGTMLRGSGEYRKAFEQLFTIRAGTLVRLLLQHWCRRRRIWSDSLRSVIVSSSSIPEDMRCVFLTYLLADSPEGRLSALTSMFEEARQSTESFIKTST
jgi:hypothetical protein